MYLELHMLQNFAPSNLNRDDTNSPKTCEFGGYRRARISSQAIKRAIRWHPIFGLTAGKAPGVRTRRLPLEIAREIAADDLDLDQVFAVVSDVFKAGGINLQTGRRNDTESRNTTILIHLDREAISRMADEFRSRWNSLMEGDKAAKQDAVNVLGNILANAVKVPDIALFGRMIEVKGNTPFGKRQLGADAASQFAHPFSTNKLAMEFDFFTAVDDLLPKGELGAGMMDTAQFNSSCFYRYANIDCNQLLKNLDGDEELTQATIEAFIRASAQAVPTGKQNSMAAHNPPSLIFAVMRDGSCWNLANAFIRPIAPSHDGDLMGRSIAALDSYWGQLTTMYGDRDINGTWLCTLDGNGVSALEPARVANFEALVEGVLGATGFAANGS